MIILRLLSLLLVVVALLVLGYDAFRYLNPVEGQPFSLTSLSELLDWVFKLINGQTDWSAVHTASWPSFAKTVIAWPAWAVIGVIGLALALLFRRRD